MRSYRRQEGGSIREGIAHQDRVLALGACGQQGDGRFDQLFDPPDVHVAPGLGRLVQPPRVRHEADATERGVVTFVYDDKPRPMQVHIFHASQFTGVPTETDEMRPAWFDLEAVPFDKMWPDDELWYPMFLAGKKFSGTFWFTNTTTIVRHELREVESLE